MATALMIKPSVNLRSTMASVQDFSDVAELDIEDPSIILPSPPQAVARENRTAIVDTDKEHLLEPRELEAVGPVIRLRSDVPPRRFEILQQWEGTVTSIEQDAFWADLRDLTVPSNPTEIVELPIDEVAISDRLLLQPGSVFYWSVGYETSSGGQIRRVSEIRLRRTPVWSRRALEAAKSLGQELFERFCGELDDAPKAR